MDTGINAYCPFSPYVPDCEAISIAGASKDQYDAAVITYIKKYIFKNLFDNFHRMKNQICTKFVHHDSNKFAVV